MRNQLLVASIVASLIGLAAAGAYAQEPAKQSSSQQPAHPAKKPKVWTNDDVSAIRSPSDTYLEKEAESAAAKQQPSPANQAAADDANPVRPKTPVPKTVEEADQLIAQRRTDISALQNYIEQTKKQVSDAPESMKSRLASRIQSRAEIIGRMQAEIADLQAAKKALAKKTATGADSSSSTGSIPPQL